MMKKQPRVRAVTETATAERLTKLADPKLFVVLNCESQARKLIFRGLERPVFRHILRPLGPRWLGV